MVTTGTGISSYLQNGGVQQTTTSQNQNSKNQETQNVKNQDEVDVVLSEESKAMLKIEALREQLQKILGTPKELSYEEQKQEEELKLQIEKINEKLQLPYSSVDKERIKELDKQMKEILQKDSLSPEDDEKLFDLSKQLNNIINGYDSPTLNEEDAQKLSGLMEELHSLQGYNNPDVSELIDAEKVYVQIDIVRTQYQISQLDKTSSSYEEQHQILSQRLDNYVQELSDLDNDKTQYQEEETREVSKQAIKNSLGNIRDLQNNFFNTSESIFTNQQQYGLSLNNNDSNENKWLGFLQSTREELYTGIGNTSATENEDMNLSNIISRIKTLHE
jgi:hypothetical protein